MIYYNEVPLSHVDSIVDSSAPLAFDTETIGKYGKIRIAQFYQAGWDTVYVVSYPNPLELAAFLLNQWPVMQFGHYDITTIQYQTGTRWYPNRYDDTFYLGRLAFPEKHEYSLDALMEYVLGFDPYKKHQIDKKEMQKAKWDRPVLPPRQLTYACIDVYYLLDVFDAVKYKQTEFSYKLDMLTTEYACDFQHNGMPILQDALQQRYKENLQRLEEVALPINCNSYKQVREYIDSDMSDDLGLATLSSLGNERAKAVREARKLKKQNSFLDKYDTPDGRIYGKFKPSARSGRLTSDDQNLQQIPRNLKSIFGYSIEDDQCLIYSDYSQLELRCICAITNEVRMANLYREGRDIHDYTAEMLFGDGFTKNDRQVAKTANFNLLYGGQLNMFLNILMKQLELKMPEDRARFIIKKWKTLWTSIAGWQDQGIKKWRNKQLSSTPLGRQYIGKLMTDQLNIENQGFGAEVAKLALHYMKPKLDEYEDVLLINFVHDSFILECPRDEEVYKPVCKIVAEAMQTAWFEATKGCQITDLPMPVDVYVGYNWGDIEDDYFYSLSLEGMECYTN